MIDLVEFRVAAFTGVENVFTKEFLGDFAFFFFFDFAVCGVAGGDFFRSEWDAVTIPVKTVAIFVDAVAVAID